MPENRPPGDARMRISDTRIAGAKTRTRVEEGPLEGRTLGGSVRILSLLGKGGMGTVYLARHEGLARDVAVKVLPERLAADPVTVERLYREARAAARLDHPNVVRVHDVGRSEEGLHYIVMEYVRGKTLAEIMREAKGPLPLERALDLVRQAALGLAAAHRAHLVHRDVKPSNLLVGEDGRLKVADLGLVKDLDAAKSLSAPGQFLGTPRYMSPEQCEARNAGPATDVYSLGVVLFELLTGRPPFTGRSQQDLVLQHLSAAAPHPSDVEGRVPRPLGEVVLKMLEKDPASRHPSLEAFLVALDAAMAPAGAATPPPIPAPAPPAAPEPRRRLFPLAAAAVSLLALGGILAWVLAKDGGAAGAPAPPSASEAWKLVAEWRRAHPFSDLEYAERLSAFLVVHGDAPEGEAARSELEAARRVIDSSYRRIDTLSETLATIPSGASGATRAVSVLKDFFLDLDATAGPQETGTSLDLLERATEQGLLDSFPLARSLTRESIAKRRDKLARPF